MLLEPKIIFGLDTGPEFSLGSPRPTTPAYSCTCFRRREPKRALAHRSRRLL